MKNKKIFTIILLATLLGGLLTTQFAYAATFGQTNDYTNFHSLNDYIRGSVFTGGDGTAQSIWAYIDPSGISPSSITFGYTGEHNNTGYSIENVIRGQELYLSGSDTYTVQDIQAYIFVGPGSNLRKAKAAIYDSSGNLMGESDEIVIGYIRVWQSGAYVYYPGWRTFTFSSTTITGGSTYRLVVWAQALAGVAELRYRNQAGSVGVYNSTFTYGSYPTNVPFSNFNKQYCMYATLTQPGSANVKTAILTSSGTWVAGSNDVSFSGTDNPGWYEFSLTTNPTISSSIDYLLAAWSDGDVEISRHDYSTQGVSQSATYDGWPSLTPSSTDTEYSIYCEYTENEDPVADADGPYEVVLGSPVQLDGSGSYDPDGTIVLWEWDLDNDGTYDASGETVSHTYPSIGTYPVTLRVTDDGGATDTDTSIVTVVEGAVVRIKKVIEWGIGPKPSNNIKFTFENSWTSDFELGDGEYMDFVLCPGSYDVTELTDGWTLDRVQILGEDPMTLSGPTVEFIVNYGDQITIIFYNRPPGFVIPENPLGTLGSLVAMVGVIFLLHRGRNGNLRVIAN